MRASSKLFQPVAPLAARSDDGKLVNVYISCQLPDLDDARTLAVWLDARGYTSAPGMVLNHQDKPRAGVTPQQADCVIVLWSPNSINDQQVKSDAGTFGLNGNLIEVCVRKGEPVGRYSKDALIVFNRLALNSDAGAWRALLARVHKHCGEPPKKPSEFRRYAPTALGALVCVATLGGVGNHYVEQNEQREQSIEAAKQSFSEPAGGIEPVLVEARKRPSLTPTTDLALASGGPTTIDQADFDVDKGTAPVGLPPAAAPAETPKPVVERVMQGPEQ